MIKSFRFRPLGLRAASSALVILACVAQATAYSDGPGPGPGPGPGNGAGAPGIHAPSTTSGACGTFMLPDTSSYQDAGDAVKALSRATKAAVEGCGCATQACIADALDAYAAKVAEVAPRLPRQLRNLPQVVSAAAHRVRKAKTKAEAAHILRAAVAQVRQEIELIRADDSETLRRETRGGEFVAGTLEFAAIKLERADGI